MSTTRGVRNARNTLLYGFRLRLTCPVGHNGLLSILGGSARPPSLLTPPFVGRRGILQHRPWTRKHHTLHSTSTQPTGAAYVSGVLRASRRTRVDDFDCTRTQGTCRTLRHVRLLVNAGERLLVAMVCTCAHRRPRITAVPHTHPRTVSFFFGCRSS